MNTIYPPAPTLLKVARYEIANVHFPKDKVPIERLAYIGAYCMVWCTKMWGNWDATPPLDVPGDGYVGKRDSGKAMATGARNIADRIIGTGESSVFVPGSRRFTSLESLYDDEEASAHAQAAALAAAGGDSPDAKRREKLQRRRSTRRKSNGGLEVVQEDGRFVTRTNDELELDEYTDEEAATEMHKRRGLGVPGTSLGVPGALPKIRQESMDANLAAANGAKILETMRLINEDTNNLEIAMELSKVDYVELPQVDIVPEGPDKGPASENKLINLDNPDEDAAVDFGETKPKI